VRAVQPGAAARRGAREQAPGLAELLSGDVVSAAAGLIGCVLACRLPAQGTGASRIVRALIVETEAYHQREPGSHAFNGRTPRNAVMFGPPGRLYVYFTYGMWHCANVVCEPAGTAAAVLLRAAMPLPPDDGSVAGIEQLRLSGPGLLCRGLQLDRQHNGANVLDRRGEVWLYRPARGVLPPLRWTRRIGFSFLSELEWRCCWDGHPAVSPASTGVIARGSRRRKADT